MAKRPHPERECSICGCRFRPINRRTLTCSPEHSAEHRKRGIKAWREANPTYDAERHVANREEFLARNRAWYQANKARHNGRRKCR